MIWLFEDKDELAFANVIGAVIFQSSFLAAIGIIITSWEINRMILTNSLIVIISSLLFIGHYIIKGKITKCALLCMGIFYFSFFIYTFLKF
ncbi:hypothetical protein IJ670_06380 [bacterium]|nr:hypothetical protein [bacterium]